MGRGRNAMSIWQDLVSDHGFSGSYQSMKRFVRKLRGSQRPGAVGIIQTKAGEEGQVDYGDGPMVRHPKTGKYRRTRLFVMTLGYSRKAVRLLPIPLQFPNLGRAARDRVSPAWRQSPVHRPGQPT